MARVRDRLAHRITRSLAKRDRAEIRAVNSLLAVMAPQRRRQQSRRRDHRSER